MRTLIKKNEWVVLTTVFFFVTILMFWLTTKIYGPFIFLDEAEYHWLASEIFHFHKFYGHQYDPLYPLLVAPTFYLNDLETHFYVIKLINIVVYGSMIFPVYLIAKKFLISKPLAILLAFTATLGPISAYAHPVWAEPLYYTLICWTYYFIARYLTSEEGKDIFIAGLFIGLSFLAKQAALLLLVSYYIYVAYENFIGSKKIDKKAIGLISLGAALFVLPWLIRNTFFGKSVIGYSAMFSNLFVDLKNNPVQLMLEFTRGIGYSIGYWIFVYFGGGFFLLLYAAFKRDTSSKNDTNTMSSLAKILILQSMFLMLASELFIASFGIPPVANGRYVDIIYPVAFIVIASVLLRLKRMSRFVTAGSALVCFVLLLLFSPLTLVEGHAAVDESGVSILNFFWPHQFFWQRINPSLPEKMTLSATLTVLLVLMLVLRKHAIWIICLCGLMLGVGAQLQIVRLGTTANPTNQIFLTMDKQHIPMDKIAIDNALQKDSIAYHMKFWHPTNFAATKFVDPITLLRKISIDFGRQENKADNNELKIWAPWNPESGFSENWGLGFSDITTLNAAKCPDIPNQGDFVFDHKPSVFKFFLPTGNYILRGKSADTRCLGVESSFFVQAQGVDGAEVHRNDGFILPFKVGSEEPGLKMSLRPNHKYLWAIDKITIEPRNKNFTQGSYPQYLLSKRLLPFPQVLRVFDYRIYKAGSSEKFVGQIGGG